MRRSKRVRAPSAKKYVSKKKSKTAMVKAFSSKNSTQGGIQNVMPVKMLYSDWYNLNPGVGGIGTSQVFRLSSIHDPDFTGVGHQPLGHDQLADLYERYQVYKVDFEIEASGLDINSLQRIGYRLSDSSSVTTDSRALYENGNGEFAVISPYGNNGRSFRGSVWVNEVHGVSYKQYMSNDDYGANFGSNPVEEAYLHVMADGLGVDTDGIRFAIRLTYHCKLMGSKLVSIS